MFLRVVRRAAIVAFIAIAALSSAQKPTHAYWAATLSGGCPYGSSGTWCATVQDVCDYWGSFYGTHCTGVGPIKYKNGRPFEVFYRYIYIFERTASADPRCVSPYHDDAGNPTGCSLAVSTPLKQLGRGCPGQCTVGNPVTVNTGNKFEVVTDFETQGQDKLAFIRSYNSQSQQTSSLGIGWQSNFDRGFNYTGSTPASATAVWFTRPDGAIYEFDVSGGVWSPHDSDVNAKLTLVGSTNWVLTDSNDVVETYTIDGQLTSIKDRSGYEQDLTYDTNGKLILVTDSFGRTLTFSIANGVISTMTDPDGKVYTYGYNTLMYSTPDRLASVTYPGTGSPTVQYKYENTDYPYALTGIVDENGHRFATWSYDTTLRANYSEHAGGADATTLSYSLNGSGVGTVTVTNALGKQTIYTLSSVASVGKITSIAGQASSHTAASTESFTYDSNGYVATHTDNNGNVTHYTNDSRGHVTSETDAYGTALARTITTTWDTTYNLPTEIVQSGLTTDFTYTSGLLTQKTETDTTTTTIPYSTNGTTRTWNYAYYTNGLLHTVDGPLSGTGDTATYTYDAQSCVASFANEVGHTTTITSVNGRCEVLASTDPNGIVTNYTYDDRGRALSVTVDPGANQSQTSFTYDAAGNLTVVTLPDSSTLAYSYDNAHRVTSVTNNLGESITYALDALGNRTATVVRSATSTITKQQTATFDELGRVMANIGAASQTTTHAYDLNNNEVTTTDPRSKVYGHAFDALNRLYRETDPNAFQTNVAYNGKDEVTSVTDARSLATSYVRDGFGDIIRQTSPDTGVTDFWYDANGNVTKQIDARSIETDFTYDNISRILAKTFPAASTENVAYTYDSTTSGNEGIGYLTSLTDQSGSSAFVYDALGHVSSDTRVVSGNSYGTAYTYDPAGHILTMTYPSGRIVTYTRDVIGRISGITTKQNSGASPVTVASSANYQPFGPLAGFTFGNSVVATFTYDQDYQLTDISAVSGSTTIQNLTNGYDPSGNITSITDHQSSSRTQTLTYDNLNRLATASGTYGSHDWGYDGVGNRVSDGYAQSYAYSPTSNQLSSVTAGGNVRSFTYLASGQLSQDVRDGSHTYTFTANDNGRLASASLNGSTVGTYLYNVFEQRVQKVAGGVTTQFVFDRLGHLLEEADASGAVQREYIWLDDLPVAMVDDTGPSPVIYYIHTDQLGMPQKMTDGSANVAWDGVFDPFGNVVPTQGTNWNAANWGSFNWADIAASLNNLRFPGQYADAETGFNQNWNRDYDPTIGRYIQSDPIGLGNGTNTYAYVGDSPGNNVDPMGLELICGSFFCGSNIPVRPAATPPPDVSPEVKAYLCEKIKECRGNMHCVYWKTDADRKTDWYNPKYRQAENFSYAAGWDSWQTRVISIYLWQYHKFIPGTHTSPFSQAALDAGLTGNSHQHDTPNQMMKWCSDCGK